MGAILAEILQIASALMASEPGVLQIVSVAIAAFHANDQASLDAAHAQALALANSEKPAGAEDLS